MGTTDQCGHIPAIEILLPSHTHTHVCRYLHYGRGGHNVCSWHWILHLPAWPLCTQSLRWLWPIHWHTYVLIIYWHICVILSFFVTPAPFDEPWDSDNEPPKELLQLNSDPYEGFSSRPDRDYLMEKAEDFLLADDPALFSDEFSGGEEWLDTY